ncbi:MAG: TonB-dependent receptor, partial [Candidatus Solibacter sp.]
SYSSGRHSMKFGGELMHDNMRDWNGSSSDGTFDFLGTYSGDAFGDFLLGYPNDVTRDYFKDLNGNRGNFWSAYAQDSFRLTPNLTINAGLRFEINSFWNGIRGQESAINLVTGKLILPSSMDTAVQQLTAYLLPLFSDRIQYTNSLGLPDSIHPSEHDWAPRIGFAWRPSGSATSVIRAGYGIFYTFPDQNPIDNTLASVPFVAVAKVFNDSPPVAPTRTWANFFLGQPNVTPNPNPGQACAFGWAALTCATPSLDSASLIVHTTYSQQWNFSVQHQITPAASIDIAYVGNKTTHANQNSSWNDPLPGPGAIQNRRPLPQWGTLTYVKFDENANYNALQAKFETRAWHDVTTLVSYAYSKCIDYGSSEGSATQALYRVNRAVCDYDLPQAFNASFDYILPFGKGKSLLNRPSRWVDQVAGGWEFSGIVTLRSGYPFTPTISSDTANTGVGSQRPNVVGTPTIVGNPNCWFYISANPACAALAPNAASAFAVPSSYTYGNSGRNILRANGLKELDFTLMKTFPVTESKRLEFRSDFFNLLNHPTFASPGTNINSSSGGQVSATLNTGRIIQLALKFRF